MSKKDLQRVNVFQLSDDKPKEKEHSYIGYFLDFGVESYVKGHTVSGSTTVAIVENIETGWVKLEPVSMIKFMRDDN